MAAHKPRIDSGYLHRFLHPTKLRTRIQYAAKALKGHKFDAIAFRGMSGALIAPAVAARLKKPLIMVRKEGEKAHTYRKVEGDCNAKRYVILDDFVSSGTTKRTIIEAVKEFAPKAQCIGLLQTDFITARTLKQYAGRKYPLHTDL